MGLGLELSTLYMLDLGLVKRIKTDTNHHIHMNSGHDLIGNSRYCSLNSHRGYSTYIISLFLIKILTLFKKIKLYQGEMI